MSLRLILCDHSPPVLAAWREQFQETPEAEVREADPLETAADAALVPGNSFGFLDSGLELKVAQAFGFEVQDRLRERIRAEYDGELLVGQAIVHRLPASSRPPALVYAPVCRVPQRLTETVNVFLALRAALLALARSELTGRPASAPPFLLAAPAMGIGPGGLLPLVSARQMRYAFEVFAGRRGAADKNLSQAQRRERKLRSLPGAGPLG